MSHTYTQNVLHIVFSTKERQRTILEGKQSRLWAYVAGICQHEGMFVHEIGGMEDHIHLLLQVPPTLTLSKAVSTIKANSSRWMGDRFSWQQGYAAFSVSASNFPTVVRYIRNQKAHHRKIGFDDEFLALLKKHGVQFDPKYVFG